MEHFSYNSVELIPNLQAKAAFCQNSQSVFEEDGNITPVTIADNLQYMPWGGDNQLPFDILDLVEKDETLSTCQIFNAEVCYGQGLVYNTDSANLKVKESIDDFFLDNSIQSYFLGVCQDFKHFGWCVTVIILSKDLSRVVEVHRKEACYCRFTPADENGQIKHILYANWRNNVQKEDIETIDLTTFYDYEEFMDFIRELHSDEKDPEFMLLDYENFPRQWYSESCIDEKTFDKIQEYWQLEVSEREAFDCFVDILGEDSIDRFRKMWQGEWDSMEDFAEYYVNEVYFDEVNGLLGMYFDYSRYASDLFSGDFVYRDGHVFNTNV